MQVLQCMQSYVLRTVVWLYSYTVHPSGIHYSSVNMLESNSSVVIGGMGPTASVVYHRLASLLSIKLDSYNKTILFIRSKLSFALLLRSAIRCIRGTRSSYKPSSDLNIDLAITEGSRDHSNNYAKKIFFLFFIYSCIVVKEGLTKIHCWLQ